ncbi:MAG: diguanylate cyclase [Deltaproteobacteria bacterium]
MTAETFKVVYGLILFLSVIIATWIIMVTWRWRRVPGSKSLMFQMIGEGFWTLCYALQLSNFIHPPSEPYFWSKMMFLGVVMVPCGFLVWASRYTKRDGWINNRTMALLLIEPILFNVIVWTDHWHGLFSGNFVQTGKLGIGFYLHTLYSYSLLFTGGIMLFINWLRMQPLYRKQALLVLMGLPISLAANAITILNLAPIKGTDFSPLGFLAAGAIFTYAQLRHRLFDLMPVARHTVVDGMRDGVMVLDNDNRIIDMNPAAQGMLNRDMKRSLGKPAASALPVWQEVEAHIAEQPDVYFEFVTETGEKRNIDLTMTVMHDKRHQPGGKLIILRDVTHIKNIEGALRETNKNLLQKIEEIEALQIKLKEQAIHDPLTGLYNRRFLEETLSRELAQADRSNEPMSLAIIDLDHFKVINDTYGHGAGDLFLIALGDLLENKIRSGDVACRFGGEEFIVVMPGAALEVAARRINEFRQLFGSHKIDIEGKSISVTFSAGVAGFPLHGADDKSIIAEADRALYAAKEAGRNRVIVAQREFI